MFVLFVLYVLPRLSVNCDYMAFHHTGLVLFFLFVFCNVIKSASYFHFSFEFEDLMYVLKLCGFISVFSSPNGQKSFQRFSWCGNSFSGFHEDCLLGWHKIISLQ